MSTAWKAITATIIGLATIAGLCGAMIELADRNAWSSDLVAMSDEWRKESDMRRWQQLSDMEMQLEIQNMQTPGNPVVIENIRKVKSKKADLEKTLFPRRGNQ